MRCWMPLAAAALLANACTSDPGKKCNASSDCPQGAHCHDTLKVCFEVADAGPGDAGGLDASISPDAGKECKQVTATEQNCGDGVDDDCNGQIDCEDPACDGRACKDDGDLCTIDTCVGGSCTHTYPVHPPTEWSNWPALPEARIDEEFVLIGGASGKVAVDKKTCLMWRRSEELGIFKWADATKACGSVVQGFEDWRLPTRIELLSLVDLKRTTQPTIDTSVFTSSPGGLWSATGDSSGSGSAWFVEFGGGSSAIDAVSKTNGVRCVR